MLISHYSTKYPRRDKIERSLYPRTAIYTTSINLHGGRIGDREDTGPCERDQHHHALESDLSDSGDYKANCVLTIAVGVADLMRDTTDAKSTHAHESREWKETASKGETDEN